MIDMRIRSAGKKVSMRFEVTWSAGRTYCCWNSFAILEEVADNSTWLRGFARSSCHEGGSRCQDGRNGSASRHGGGLVKGKRGTGRPERVKDREEERGQREQNERQYARRKTQKERRNDEWTRYRK